MTREALKRALEALERYTWAEGIPWQQTEEAITAIKQALAAPMQEPVASLLLQSKQTFEHNFGPSSAADWIYSDMAELMGTTPPAQPAPVQEPVAWVTGLHAGRCVIRTVNPAAILPVGIALYTHPAPEAQRQWTGLTDEDYNTNMFSITSLGACDIATIKSIAKDVEAKLKEKNNG